MESVKVGVKLAPYNPTNNDAIDIALHMLNIRPNETIYDLGCGDARFLVSVSV
jgi:precorrin-6B methylase 2